jgi:orotate phosphoribosyltransferase
MRGHFTLTSGKTSDYYLDCRLTTLDPQGAYLTGYTILGLLAEHGIQADGIGGLTMGADRSSRRLLSSATLRTNLCGRSSSARTARFMADRSRSRA